MFTSTIPHYMKNKLYTLYEHTVRSNMGNSEKTVITDFSASEMN
jgi:hypothetical protein